MPFLDLPDARIFYKSQGDGGTPIVFVHGALCGHEDWNSQFAHFGTRQRVVACDLRGGHPPAVVDAGHHAQRQQILLGRRGQVALRSVSGHAVRIRDAAAVAGSAGDA